jgi:hypothetical protein
MSTDVEQPLRIPAGAHTGRADLPDPEAAANARGPSPEEIADATNGSLAARMRAKHEEIKKSAKQFPVPGWDGDLVIVARVLRDRKKLSAGLTNEQLIVEVTTQVLYRDEEGELKDCGGWQGVGKLMGVSGDFTLGQIVRAVLDNPLRLDAFAETVIAWVAGRQSVIERVLGE